MMSRCCFTFRQVLLGLLSLGLIFSISACAPTGLSVDMGKESFNKKHYRQAFIRLLPAAEAGNPDAQYAVAYMYFYGQGVVEDRNKAIYWMKNAAKLGQPKAQQAMEILKSQPPSPYRSPSKPKDIPL